MKNGYLVDVVKNFSEKKIVVIGDFVVDSYIYCTSIGQSREAPVLVVKEESSINKAGCCANIACNIQSLGGKVFVIGLIGKDKGGDFLIEHFNELGINTDYLKQTMERVTPRITRYMVRVPHSRYQEEFRVDRKEERELAEGYEEFIIRTINQLEVDGVGTIVIGDYGGGYEGEGNKGLITEKILEAISSSGLLSVGDSRYRTDLLRDIDYVFPNDYEASLALYPNQKVIKELADEEVKKVGSDLIKKLGNKAVVMTRGAKGITIFERDKPIINIPTYAQEIFDVTGAGDTVTAAASVALANGVNIIDAAKIANYAAAIVIRKQGTATASSEELIKEIERNSK